MKIENNFNRNEVLNCFFYFCIKSSLVQKLGILMNYAI